MQKSVTRSIDVNVLIFLYLHHRQSLACWQEARTAIWEGSCAFPLAGVLHGGQQFSWLAPRCPLYTRQNWALCASLPARPAPNGSRALEPFLPRCICSVTVIRCPACLSCLSCCAFKPCTSCAWNSSSCSQRQSQEGMRLSVASPPCVIWATHIKATHCTLLWKLAVASLPAAVQLWFPHAALTKATEQDIWEQFVFCGLKKKKRLKKSGNANYQWSLT